MPRATETDSVESSPALISVEGGGTTRQAILATARRLFEEQGYDATSLRQIADEVGMTKAAVYYHYPAKEHLLLEITGPMLDDISRLVARLRSDEEPLDERAALAAYLDLYISHLPALRLLARDPATHNHPDVGRRIRALVEEIQRRVAGPDASTDRIVRTACALGVIHGIGTLPPDLTINGRDVILSAAVAALSG